MKIGSCETCAAHLEEIRFLRQEIATARQQLVDALQRASESSAAERRDLTLKLSALADTRAAQLLYQKVGAKPQPPLRKEEIALPPWAANSAAGGHINLDDIGRQAEAQREAEGRASAEGPGPSPTPPA